MPVKILHIIEPVVSGTRTHLLQILCGLPRSEFHQSLLCSVERDESFMNDVKRLRGQGIRVEIVPMKREPSLFSDFIAFRRIYRHLRRHRYDIVHTHCAKAGVLGRVAAFLTRKPYIVHTPHVFPFTQHLPYYRQLEYRLIETLLGAITDRLVVVSEYQRSLAAQYGIGRQGCVRLIHNGVDMERFAAAQDRSTIREELGVKPNDILVGTAGRLTVQKGQKYFIEAAAILLDRHPHLRFYLVGSGELEEHLRGMIAELSWCRQRVLFLGERQDMPQLLAATDIFVLPSLWEGLPYALLEAMAAAKAVICSNVCGMAEVIQNGVNGLLVPPANTSALAGAISRLVEDRTLRKRLGAAAQKTIAKGFRMEEKLQKLAMMYKELVPPTKAARKREPS